MNTIQLERGKEIATQAKDIKNRIDQLLRVEKAGIDSFVVEGNHLHNENRGKLTISATLEAQPESVKNLISASVICIREAYERELDKLEVEFDAL